MSKSQKIGKIIYNYQGYTLRQGASGEISMYMGKRKVFDGYKNKKIAIKDLKEYVDDLIREKINHKLNLMKTRLSDLDDKEILTDCRKFGIVGNRKEMKELIIKKIKVG